MGVSAVSLTCFPSELPAVFEKQMNIYLVNETTKMENNMTRVAA